MSPPFNVNTVVAYAQQQVRQLQEINALDRDAWIELHARKRLLSGRLTHAWRNRARYEDLRAEGMGGVDWEEQYLRERVQFTYGLGAQSVPKSRITRAPVKLEYGDIAMTETCWFADTYYEKSIPSSTYAPAQIEVEYSNSEKVSGVGLWLLQADGNRPHWLPKYHEVFAFTSHVTIRPDGKKVQSQVRNPGLLVQFGGPEDEVLKTLEQRIHAHYEVGQNGWMAEHRVSETLGRNASLPGYTFFNHYQHERAAAVYGYGFDVALASNIHIGPAISEGDSDPHVQIGRFLHVLNANDIFGDKFSAHHLTVKDMWGAEQVGLGIVVDHAHRPNWVNSAQRVFALIAVVDPKTKQWLPTINPC